MSAQAGRCAKFCTNLPVNCFQEQVSKRARLEVPAMLEPANDSFMSTTSVKFTAKATGNLPADSSRTTQARNLANAKKLKILKGKGWFCF